MRSCRQLIQTLPLCVVCLLASGQRTSAGDPPEVLPAPDSGATSVTNYFDSKAVTTNTCVSGRGLFQWGSWGITPLPLPVYREGRGWDLGADLTIGWDPDRPGGAPVIAEALAYYNEREHETGGQLILTPQWYRRGRWRVTSPIQAFSLPERRGVVVSGVLGRGWGDGKRSFSLSAKGAIEEYTALKVLGPAYWTTGKHVWNAASLQGQGFLGSWSEDLAAHVTGAVGTNWGSGDFVYRRFEGRVAWAVPRTTVWLAGGASSGNLPIQNIFDLAVEGGVRGIPQWSARARRFWALGAEQRTHVWQEFYAGAFATAAGGSGHSATVFESGVCLIAALDEANTYPHDWFIQLDIPLYVSQADRYGSTSKWDTARFMLRVNFFIPNVDRDDIIRYRHPNR